MPLLIENGGMSCNTSGNVRRAECWFLVSIAAILRDPADDRSPVADDDKVATFYAAAELNVRYFLFELESTYD
jgi:hypothetical protein